MKKIILARFGVFAVFFLAVSVHAEGGQGQCCFSHNWIPSGATPAGCLTQATCSDIAKKGLNVRCYFPAPSSLKGTIDNKPASPADFRCDHRFVKSGTKIADYSCKRYPPDSNGTSGGEALYIGSDGPSSGQPAMRFSGFDFMEACNGTFNDFLNGRGLDKSFVDYEFEFNVIWEGKTGGRVTNYVEGTGYVTEDLYGKAVETVAKGKLKVMK